MIQRFNMTGKQEEAWRPPVFSASKNVAARSVFFLRRFFDLQASSIWSDLVQELPDVQGTAVDVGCGAQPYRSLFRSTVEYIGIDTADAEAHFGYRVEGTRYYSGDVWPIADGSVTFILSTETMEHVPDSPAFLAQANRCLAKGGRLLLTVPFSARWHYIPHDYWRFTPSTLQRLLTEAGFTGIAVYARGNAVTVACAKVMALITPLLLPQGKSFLLSLILRLLALPLIPVFVLLGCVGNLSLQGQGGDDCLGYTVIATKA